MDNRHRRYIVACVESELDYNLYRRHRYILVSIYMLQYDCRHDIGRLVHNCMGLDSVHLRKPNGMDSPDLMCIRAVRKQPTDCHDIHLSNSNVHDDYNQSDKLHFDRIEFDHKLQYNYDSRKRVLLDNHYQHGIRLER